MEPKDDVSIDLIHTDLWPEEMPPAGRFKTRTGFILHTWKLHLSVHCRASMDDSEAELLVAPVVSGAGFHPSFDLVAVFMSALHKAGSLSDVV